MIEIHKFKHFYTFHFKKDVSQNPYKSLKDFIFFVIGNTNI